VLRNRFWKASQLQQKNRLRGWTHWDLVDSKTKANGAPFHRQTDRQTILFNIWQNQISGGGQWPQGLRVILPLETQSNCSEETQVQLLRRRPTVYKFHIDLLISTKWCRHILRTCNQKDAEQHNCSSQADNLIFIICEDVQLNSFCVTYKIGNMWLV